MVDKGKQTNRFMANGISRSFKWVTVIHELEPELFLFGTLSDSLYLYDMKKRNRPQPFLRTATGSQIRKVGKYHGHYAGQ